MATTNTVLGALAAVVFVVGCGGPQVSAPASANDEAAQNAKPNWVQDDIEKGMAKISPALAACYQTAVKSNKAEAGSVTISASIAADGRVQSATPVETTLSEGLANCLVGVIRTAQFKPPGVDGVRLRIPLAFQQQPDSADKPSSQ